VVVRFLLIPCFLFTCISGHIGMHPLWQPCQTMNGCDPQLAQHDTAHECSACRLHRLRVCAGVPGEAAAGEAADRGAAEQPQFRGLICIRAASPPLTRTHAEPHPASEGRG
jgi:hypothetical protein